MNLQTPCVYVHRGSSGVFSIVLRFRALGPAFRLIELKGSMFVRGFGCWASVIGFRV